MSRNAWIIFSVICIAVLGGLVWMSQGNRLDVSNVNALEVQAANEDNGNLADHTIGNTDAKVTIIEYGDFQCPGCASAAPVLKQIADKYQDDVLFIFRNFPLSTIHPNARAAAAAAEAAGLQGKYWEMHEKLFSTQGEWGSLGGAQRTDMFAVYARELGIDSDKLTEDLGSSDISAKINYDSAIGKKIGVSGTPAIYINGEKIDYYVKDGKRVNNTVEGANPVWSQVSEFEELSLKPALEKAGVKLE